MKKTLTKSSQLPGLLFLLIFFQHCSPRIALFDQYAYTRATSLKVDALALMGKATQTYFSQKVHVESLFSDIEKIYEYETHRPKNSISSTLWSILKNPAKNLLGGFLRRWESGGTLSPDFIDQMKIQVGQAFDIIIELESEKIKENDNRVKSLIGNN